jgi:hypothetical protein
MRVIAAHSSFSSQAVLVDALPAFVTPTGQVPPEANVPFRRPNLTRIRRLALPGLPGGRPQGKEEGKAEGRAEGEAVGYAKGHTAGYSVGIVAASR